MIDHTTLITYILIVLGFVFIPGPATLLTMARAASSGTRVGIATGAGIAAGDVVHTTHGHRRPLCDHCNVGATVQRRQIRGRRLPDLSRRSRHARQDTDRGEWRCARDQRSAGIPAGRADRSAQSQDRAVLPRVPAAVRPSRTRLDDAT